MAVFAGADWSALGIASTWQMGAIDAVNGLGMKARIWSERWISYGMDRWQGSGTMGETFDAGPWFLSSMGNPDHRA